MAEVLLVDEIWPDVSKLRSLLRHLDAKPLAEALTVDASGEWQLLVVLEGVAVRGTRPVFAMLDAAAESEDADYRLLTHLVLLDPTDAEAQRLVELPVSGPERPRRFSSQTISDRYGESIAVLSRNDRLWTLASVRQLESEVLRVLQEHGWEVSSQPAMASGVRPDMAVYNRDQTLIGLVEIGSGHSKNWRNRIRDAAGMANLAATPVVFVYRTHGQTGPEPAERYGFVPVLPLDWEHDGESRLLEVVEFAGQWMTTHPDVERVRQIP